MERSPFLPLPEGMIIGQIEIAEAQLTVAVISTQPFARCPSCGSPSDHVHCQYQRTVHDVPCGDRRVVLRLCVRKFFCRVPSCHRKVFAERLPDLVQLSIFYSKQTLSPRPEEERGIPSTFPSLRKTLSGLPFCIPSSS